MFFVKFVWMYIDVYYELNRGYSMKYRSLFGLGVCILTNMAFSEDVYVSPSGDDAAAGTLTAPLATIAAARDKADALKASGPVTVYLLKGTYYLKEPLVFGPSNSGTATAPIRYKGSGKAVISGGIKVTTAWTASSGSIMKTTIATGLKVDQLFLNGKRQIMARYPNFKETDMLQGSASDALSKAQGCANPTEGPGYIRSLHSSMWGGESYILTKSGSTINATWVGDNNRGSGMHTTYRMAENCYEFLDAAGEWFYRKSTGDLFFWPPSGTDLTTAAVELASLSELLRFVGASASACVQYIQFDNVIFTHAYRTLFDGTGDFYEKITKSDWGMVRKGTVFMQNAENIAVKNCLFDQIGGNGVFFSGHNRNHIVSNCDFEDAGASCVCLFGLRSSIRCPNSWSGSVSCSDKTPGPNTNGEYPSFITIDNNMMNHGGRFEKQTAGVTLSASEFDTIRHNTIHNIPRAGINFCDGCWGGHVVEYNWVYDCVKESGDHGPFNAWGRDRNEIFGQNDVPASKYDARNTTIVRNNRFESNAGMFGIDLDDQATNYYQTSNLLMYGGYKLQWNRYNTYLNGILCRGANAQFHGVWSQSSHYGARNIIVGSQNYSCIYQCLSGNSPSSIKGAIAQWDSNDVYCGGSQPTLSTWSQNAGCGSSAASWSDWKNAGLDAHSSNADPQFTDTQKVWRADYLPRGDFNPKSGSPALALGFKPFAMDSFGVMGTPGLIPTNITADGPFETPDRKSLYLDYNTCRLTVSFGGKYRVAITSASGRTLATFDGNGRSNFALGARRLGSGMYFAVVYSQNGFISRRFIVSK
jgi:hypothetical protein